MNDNYENISYFLLNNKTSYVDNFLNWENSLIEDSMINIKNEQESEQESDEEIEEEKESESNNQDTQNKSIEDIIVNKEVIL